MVRCSRCGKQFNLAESIDANILALLKEKPLRWSALLERSGCSKRALSMHLKKLRKQGKVKRYVVDEGYPPPVYYAVLGEEKK